MPPISPRGHSEQGLIDADIGPEAGLLADHQHLVTETDAPRSCMHQVLAEEDAALTAPVGCEDRKWLDAAHRRLLVCCRDHATGTRLHDLEERLTDADLSPLILQIRPASAGHHDVGAKAIHR